MKPSRIVTMLSILTIVATVASACGAQATPANAPAPTTAPAAPTAGQAAPTPAAAAQPTTAQAAGAPPAAAAGTLIASWGALSRPFDQTGGDDWLIKIFSPLVSFNADLTGLAPQLATKWTPNADATVWTFNLRPNVKWHDGQPFTADDVQFTFQLAFNPAFGWRNEPGIVRELIGASEYISGTTKTISGLKVVDLQTVEFSLNKSDPKFAYKLTGSYAAFMLPAHALKDQDPAKLAKSDWFFATPIGTGPFKLSKYVKDQYQDLVPNDDYWNGKPKLAHLINRFFADDASADIAFEKGEIQFTPVAADVATRLKANPNDKVFEGLSYVPNYIIFNWRDKRFQDVRVRQAFLYAIDRKAIVKEVFKDANYVVPCTMPQKEFWPSDVNAYDYNPDKAQQLLKDANWNSGDTFELWAYYNSQQQKDALQAIQQYLAQVGINVTPKIMDGAAYNATFYTGEGWTMSYRGNSVVYGQSLRPYLLPSTQTKDKKSWAGLDDPKLTEFINGADTSLMEEGYVSNMQNVCRYLNQNAIEAPLWASYRYGVVSAKVKNFYYFPAPGGGPYEDHAEQWEITQ